MPFEKHVRKATGARKIVGTQHLQSLWSGYGEILRVELEGGDYPSVIVKHVNPKRESKHPRGWGGNVSHQRKLKSYAVEMRWYQDFALRCSEACRVPKPLRCLSEGTEWLFVLEDLDAAGFPQRKHRLNAWEVEACLGFLAAFHATFMGQAPDGLWKTGTYWHLATRPEELSVMGNQALKRAAQQIDERLRQSPFQTLVHGDAKVANFCFGAQQEKPAVAAVDFQYVGGGVGIKDIAYFFSSIWDESECESLVEPALGYYFECLSQALVKAGSPVDPGAVEHEWRELYPLAWADFYRFLDGWAPGHYKMNQYSLDMTQKALTLIG